MSRDRFKDFGFNNFSELLSWCRIYLKDYSINDLRELRSVYRRVWPRNWTMGVKFSFCEKCEKAYVAEPYNYSKTTHCKVCNNCTCSCNCVTCNNCNTKHAHKDFFCKNCKNCPNCCECIFCADCGIECGRNHTNCGSCGRC